MPGRRDHLFLRRSRDLDVAWQQPPVDGDRARRALQQPYQAGAAQSTPRACINVRAHTEVGVAAARRRRSLMSSALVTRMPTMSSACGRTTNQARCPASSRPKSATTPSARTSRSPSHLVAEARAIFGGRLASRASRGLRCFSTVPWPTPSARGDGQVARAGGRPPQWSFRTSRIRGWAGPRGHGHWQQQCFQYVR